MSLPGIDRRWTPAAKRILPLLHDSHMGGIATGAVIANDVIDHGNSMADSSWKWSDQVGIHESMNHFGPSPEIEGTIAPILDFGTSPVPATSLRVDPQSLSDANQFTLSQICFKIFHANIIRYAVAGCKNYLY